MPLHPKQQSIHPLIQTSTVAITPCRSVIGVHVYVRACEHECLRLRSKWRNGEAYINTDIMRLVARYVQHVPCCFASTVALEELQASQRALLLEE